MANREDTVIHPGFHGKIIFATPGSGKTWLARNAQGRVVNADDLLLNSLGELYPRFRINPNLRPGPNLYRFCCEYSREELDNVYQDVKQDIMTVIAYENATVLTGSVALMQGADYVFVQSNNSLLPRGYKKRHAEIEEATKWGKVPIRINGRLSGVLSRDPAGL